MRKNCFFIALILLMGCKSKPQYNNPHIAIQTKYGNIEIELFPKQAPKTVAAFLSYVDSGFYYNSSFYRALNMENQPSNAPKTELIQGGIWKTNYQKAINIKGIEHESTAQTKILHKEGVISLARAKPGTAGTEFFIVLSDQPGLDFGGENCEDKQGYAAFGRVVNGLDLVFKISGQRLNGQYLSPQVDIFNIVRL
ncbi:MAG: peptidylprolyl isomerase [Chitinophagaceae bacterium]|nr:peptidylprolyl isomerase [Chitinophagaceae bacterium]